MAIGDLPTITNLQQHLTERIARFEGELDPESQDVNSEVTRARIIELKNIQIIVNGIATNQKPIGELFDPSKYKSCWNCEFIADCSDPCPQMVKKLKTRKVS